MEVIQNHTLTSKVRAILVDWLVEVALEFDFRDETLYLAVQLVDRSLAKFRVRSFVRVASASSLTTKRRICAHQLDACSVVVPRMG